MESYIAAHYAWEAGNCFRCGIRSVATTLLARIDTPQGTRYDVRACRKCVLGLEDERRRDAERTGMEYVPGGLGENRAVDSHHEQRPDAPEDGSGPVDGAESGEFLGSGECLGSVRNP